MILTDEDIEAMRAGDDCGEAAPEFLRIVRIAEAAVLRKLREREPSGYLIDWPDEPDLGDYFAYEPSGCGRSRPLHIIPEDHE